MIELIVSDTCTACNICVTICPTNVFDAVPGSLPIIARQSDCQTCFMCEAYCPADALYVGHNAETATGADPTDPATRSTLGDYRKALGWTPETRERRAEDQSHALLDLLRH